MFSATATKPSDRDGSRSWASATSTNARGDRTIRRYSRRRNAGPSVTRKPSAMRSAWSAATASTSATVANRSVDASGRARHGAGVAADAPAREQPPVRLERDLRRSAGRRTRARLLAAGRAEPRAAARASPASSPIAAASARGSRTGTSRPVTPSSTTCRQPRMFGGDDGHAHRGRLHRRAREALAVRREHVHVHPRVQALARRSRPPRKRTPAASAARRGRRPSSASPFSCSSSPITANRTCGRPLAQLRGRVEHLEVALLAHEPADQPDHDVVGPARAELRARGRARRRR